MLINKKSTAETLVEINFASKIYNLTASTWKNCILKLDKS